MFQNFSARWRAGGAVPPNVNLGPPDISETTTARKLNLKILLDMVKYPHWCDVYVGGKVRVSEFMIFLDLQHCGSK